MKFYGRLSTLPLILALAVFGLAGCSRDTGVEAAREDDAARLGADQPVVSPAEQDFMTKVTQTNVAEIMFARQAMQKSSNKSVRDFAHMLETDHSMALDRLTEVMEKHKVAQSRAMTTEAAQELDMMATLSGGDYDREYANLMVEKHQKSVELFRNHAETAQNSDVKDYATDLLPTLEMHLEKARSLQSELFRGVGR